MKIFIAFFLGLLVASVASAVPIPVSSWERVPDGLLLHMRPGTMKLQVCENRIVRVVYSPTNAIPEQKSFVVTKVWPTPIFATNETADEVSVATSELFVAVNRRSGAITFCDKSGRVLLQEPADGGKSMTPSTTGTEQTIVAEQKFACPPDESLYGLGQYQDGLWNWRGLPREIRQNNTQIGLPMLVSSRGYGLLWDNASLTDFNPMNNEVPLVLESQPATQDTTNKSKALVISTWHGKFTSSDAGEYVFFASTDNNRGEFSLQLDGREIVGVSNYWTPFTLCALPSLPANKTCEVTIRSGGKGAKLFVGRRANTTTFRSHFADVIDYTFFYGPELDEVIRGYRVATGDAQLWPEWAYGFWQCRERYHSQEELLNSAAEFRRRKIPIDLIIQDWRYWPDGGGWGNYDWDKKRYPDPAGMIEKLHAENIKFMISVWCNPNGSTREELNAKNLIVAGHVDVFSPLARQIRWNHINDAFFKIGTDAWWGDSTEPGDTGRALMNQKTALGLGDTVRNAYPLFASESLYEGQRSASSSKRVCILTRSAFPGLQRYASASWSGDISGNWQAMKRQIPAGLNFCITGIPYWTTDCGGFWHPADQYTSPDYNELLARWFEWSTFCPILRIHGGDTATEMWNWLPATQKILLAYDRLRYRMLPYNYSVASRVTRDGDTMMRPLVMDFRMDKKALSIGDEYLFGPAFLVAPVTEPQATNKSVYLPDGTSWVDFWSGQTVGGGKSVDVAAPLGQIPLFARAGSVMPLGPVVQFAGEKPADPLELRVYRGADGAFTLYEDEGDNYNYERGAYATIPILWNEKTQALTIGARAGKFSGMLEKRIFRVVFVSTGHGVGGEATEKADAEIHYEGKPVTIHFKPTGAGK